MNDTATETKNSTTAVSSATYLSGLTDRINGVDLSAFQTMGSVIERFMNDEVRAQTLEELRQIGESDHLMVIGPLSDQMRSTLIVAMELTSEIESHTSDLYESEVPLRTARAFGRKPPAEKIELRDKIRNERNLLQQEYAFVRQLFLLEAMTAFPALNVNVTLAVGDDFTLYAKKCGDKLCTCGGSCLSAALADLMLGD